MSSEENLGRLIRVHRTGIGKYWQLIVISLLMLVLLGLFLFVGSKQDRAFDSDFISLYVILLILAILALLPAWYYGVNEARVFEDGFEYVTRRKTVCMRWDELKYIYRFSIQVNINGIPTPSQTKFSVRGLDDTIVRFSPRLDDVERLGQVLFDVAKRRDLTVWSGLPSRYALRHPTQKIELN